MSYSQPLSSQVIIFIYSVGFGVLLGLTYEVFTVLRMLLSDKKWAYILCDTAFTLIGSTLSFFFMVLFNNGIVRLNLILAQLVGALCFHFSVGRYIIKPLLFISEKLRKLISLILFPIRFVFEKAEKLAAKLRQKQQNKHSKTEKMKKEKKKIKNIIKIPLKKFKK